MKHASKSVNLCKHMKYCRIIIPKNSTFCKKTRQNKSFIEYFLVVSKKITKFATKFGLASKDI